MDRLIIFKSAFDNDIIQSFLSKNYDKVSHLLSLELIKKPLPAPVFPGYFMDSLLASENLFAVEGSKNTRIVPSLYQSAAKEIAIIQQALANYEEPVWLTDCSSNYAGDSGDEYYKYLGEFFHDWQHQAPEIVLDKMKAFHKQNGYGYLVRHRVWRWQGKLVGVSNPDSICLSDLIGYDNQKQELMANLQLFVEAGKGNNMLLYGQRGTGKSSMIKAAANEFGSQGLGLIEVPMNYLQDLPRILDILKHQSRRYLIFIDDLSFDGADHNYKEMKAILEGGVEVVGKHILLCATSNRRHLVQEEWSDRNDTGMLRIGDTLSEKLSLADRFGITIVFPSPDQQEYLDIVLGLAEQENLNLDRDTLIKEALKWGKWQNSPSGRTARQFINSLAKTK